MKRKIVILVTSLVAGLAAAVLTHLYMSVGEEEVERERAALRARYEVSDVLCFKVDTPGGTALQRSDLGLISVPRSGLRGQALTKENLPEILGRKTLLGHRKGDIIFWSDIEGGNPRDTGLSSEIRRQMRAISITVSGPSSVSGMVRPNDHVDVIATFTFPDKDGVVDRNGQVTCTMLQNVLVLATGRETSKIRPEDEFGRGYATVTLEVTPREAELIAFAEQIKGRLVLTLRNRSDMSYEKELPKVDFAKVQEEIETLNLKRQQRLGGR